MLEQRPAVLLPKAQKYVIHGVCSIHGCCALAERPGAALCTTFTKCCSPVSHAHVGLLRIHSLANLHDWAVFLSPLHMHHVQENNVILGGNVHLNYVGTSEGYVRTATNEPRAWLFSIKPNNPDKVEIAVKFNGQSGGWRAYYANNANYLMCMGGGHDMCCNTGGHCWNYAGHDYRPPVSGGYGSASYKNWAGGVYAWNGRNEGDMYEVYRVLK